MDAALIPYVPLKNINCGYIGNFQVCTYPLLIDQSRLGKGHSINCGYIGAIYVHLFIHERHYYYLRAKVFSFFLSFLRQEERKK